MTLTPTRNRQMECDIASRSEIARNCEGPALGLIPPQGGDGTGELQRKADGNRLPVGNLERLNGIGFRRVTAARGENLAAIAAVAFDPGYVAPPSGYRASRLDRPVVEVRAPVQAGENPEKAP